MTYTEVLRVFRTAVQAGTGSRALRDWTPLGRRLAIAPTSELELELERERTRCERRDAVRLMHEVGDGLLEELAAIAYITAAARHDAIRAGEGSAAALGRISNLLISAMQLCRSAVENQALFLTQRHGLLTALRHLVEMSNALGGPHSRLVADGAWQDDLPASSAYELYRIAEEALLHAREQSADTQVVVRVQAQAQQLVLEIEDDGEQFGTGRRPKRTAGMALAHYRARGLGGRLTLSAGRTAGLTVHCEIPLADAHPLELKASVDARLRARAEPARGVAIAADGP